MCKVADCVGETDYLEKNLRKHLAEVHGLDDCAKQKAYLPHTGQLVVVKGQSCIQRGCTSKASFSSPNAMQKHLEGVHKMEADAARALVDQNAARAPRASGNEGARTPAARNVKKLKKSTGSQEPEMVA